MLLKNVRLETGFYEKEKNNLKTKTDLFDIEIKDGKFTKISKSQDNNLICSNESEIFDAEGMLMLPSLHDNHMHLDKGHFGGDWQAVIPMSTVQERIKEEQEFLVPFLDTLKVKAKALIDLICGYGVTSMRVQVNVDPVIQLKNFYLVKEVLDENKDILDSEMVAFPQHGTVITQSLNLLDDALKEGIELVGGLDPSTIDFDIEKSLKIIFELAKKYSCGIDIHLHNSGTLGLYEIKRIINYTRTYNMSGKVTLSHAFSLSDASYTELLNLAKDFKELGIELNSTVPLHGAPPIFELKKLGVNCHIVNDNINDHWSPFGTGDLVGRLAIACEMFNQVSEYDLNRSYSLITDGRISLSDYGEKIWPNVNDEADFLLTNASCSSEFVARVSKKRLVFKNGRLIYK